MSTDNNAEKDVLANLYDRIYAILTYSPTRGEGTGMDAKAIAVQMTQNEVLNLESFADALSGGNPGGDITTAEAFSLYVDKVPTKLDGAVWAPGDALAKRYGELVSGASIDPKLLPSKEQEDTYRRLQALLQAEVEKKSLVTGAVTRTIADSPLFTAYKEAKEAYTTALLDGAQVVLDADLSTNAGKRQANLDKRRADAVVDARYKDWVAAGKSDVDEILDALESIKNNAISAVIADARATMDPAKWLTSNTEIGQTWMLASATPSNWTEPTCKGTTLTVSSDSLEAVTNNSATTYANSSRGWFWWGSNESSGSTETKDMGMQSTALELSAELVLVRIQRPWLNELLFTMQGWSNNGYSSTHAISDGKGGGGALPGIPIAFVMARNVTIKATFSSSASSLFKNESRTSSSSGWGWGPFGGGNNSSTSKSSGDTFSSEGNTVTISFRQPQVIAWINKFVPACPT